MKAIFALLVLSFSICGAQSVRPTAKQGDLGCDTVLKVDSTLYPGTADEKIDRVTVCSDGKLIFSHIFTPPDFGKGTEPSTSDYHGEIDKNTLSDLKKVLRKGDIVRLSEQKDVNVIRKQSHLDAVMRYSIFDRGTERTITFRGSLYDIGCAEGESQPSQPIFDLLCLFADLTSRAQGGIGITAGGDSCGCKSLHQMASATKT